MRNGFTGAMLGLLTVLAFSTSVWAQGAYRNTFALPPGTVF